MTTASPSLLSEHEEVISYLQHLRDGLGRSFLALASVFVVRAGPCVSALSAAFRWAADGDSGGVRCAVAARLVWL